MRISGRSTYQKIWKVLQWILTSTNGGAPPEIQTSKPSKFQPFVTSIYAKNVFAIFRDFAFFFLFDLENDLKIQIWPDSPNKIRGCPIFFILYNFFVRSLHVPQKSFLIFLYMFYYLNFECHFWPRKFFKPLENVLTVTLGQPLP